VRYQEIERSPQHYGGRSVGWKCARCRGQVEQGIRAAAKFNQSVKVPPLVGR
jgi:cytochrome c